MVQHLCYLANIFEELNILNKQLQATNKTLADAKAKIFGFITFIELCLRNIFVIKILKSFIGSKNVK